MTLENHVVVGGLGSLVAETLFEAGMHRPMVRVGIPDRFIECGSLPYPAGEVRNDGPADRRAGAKAQS